MEQRPPERNNRCSLGMLPTIQKKVLEGKMQEAEDLISQYMFAAPYSMPRYECLGELDLALNQHTPFISSWTPHSLDIDSYKGSLDLMKGVYTLTHSQDGVTYTREMFISYPAQVLCLRAAVRQAGAINLDIQMDRQKYSDQKSLDDRQPGVVKRGGRLGRCAPAGKPHRGRQHHPHRPGKRRASATPVRPA